MQSVRNGATFQPGHSPSRRGGVTGDGSSRVKCAHSDGHHLVLSGPRCERVALWSSRASWPGGCDEGGVGPPVNDTKQGLVPLSWLQAFTNALRAPSEVLPPTLDDSHDHSVDGSPVGGGTFQWAVPIRADRKKSPGARWRPRAARQLHRRSGRHTPAASCSARAAEPGSGRGPIGFLLRCLGILGDALRFRACKPVLNKTGLSWR